MVDFVLVLSIGGLVMMFVVDLFKKINRPAEYSKRDHINLMKEISRHAEQQKRWESQSSSEDYS